MGCTSCPRGCTYTFSCKLGLKKIFLRPGEVQVHPLHPLATPMDEASTCHCVCSVLALQQQPQYQPSCHHVLASISVVGHHTLAGQTTCYGAVVITTYRPTWPATPTVVVRVTFSQVSWNRLWCAIDHTTATTHTCVKHCLLHCCWTQSMEWSTSRTPTRHQLWTL